MVETTEHLADVVPLSSGHRRVERINGIRLPLGSMTVSELVALHETCISRVEEAQTDVMIVADYLAQRFGDTTEPA